MNGLLPFLSLLVTLIAMIFISGGVMIWLAQVTGETLTPVQSTVLDTADWMIKTSAGAIAGLTAGGRILNGKPKSAPSA